MSKILNDAMIELEKIFVLNSRNVITDKTAINQIGNSVLRARQLSNLLTAGADDAVLLDTYATETLPVEIASSGRPGAKNPAEPLGGIVIYHNGQDTAGSRLKIDANNGEIESGYVAETRVTDLLGDSLKRVKTINANVKNPSEKEVSLGIIEVNTPFLALPVRNVLPVSLFCNSIPTIEMSRAVPSVSVRVISPVAAVDNDGNSKTLTIGSILGGPSEKLMPGTVGHDIATATRGVRLPYGTVSPMGKSTSTPEDKNAVQQSVFGMEMFTMPQTLLNANRDVGDRSTLILDKFRPLMSLNSVSINIVPAGQAAFAYKEATINITIHDRSRMQDVAQLLRPDQFGFNYIEIEYGWVHPEDPGTNNPYAPLINAFRQRELYTVVSSNVSMGEGGSVSVSIRCSLKGARDLLRMSPISDQWASTTQAEQIFQHMSKTITEIIKENDSYSPEDIRYVETLRSISATGSSGRFAISADEMAIIKEALQKLKSSGDKSLTELRKDLVSAFGEDGNGGEYKKVVEKASEVFEAKITAMTKSKELYEFGKQSTGHAEIDDHSILPSDNKKTRKYVTFGKMIATMLGSPLTTGNFSEVQLYFYTFNSDAGAVNRRNIAEFPIPFSSIRTAFAEPIKTDPKMPLSKMLRILISLVNDSSALAYGIQQPPKLDPGKTESDADIKRRKESNSASMTRYKCKSTSFSKPIIEYKMDSIRIGDKPVLRIHFFDKRCTPNDEALYLLDASLSGGGSVELNSLVRTLQQGDSGNFATVLQQAEAAKIVNVSTVKDKKTYTLNTNNRALKSFIKRTVPYLTYGTPTSMMQSFSLQSIEMADFETALLMQAANGSRIPGQQFLDSPQNDMQIFPMNISVSMLGCPLIEYAQEFFIDLDTGTSIDNVYVVNGVRHEIAAGTFKTDLELKLTRSTGAGSAIDSKIRNLLKTIDSRQAGSTPAS